MASDLASHGALAGLLRDLAKPQHEFIFRSPKRQYPYPLSQFLSDTLTEAMLQNIRNQIQEIKSGQREDSKAANHRTIFYEIINSDLPPPEKSDSRLAQDGQTMVIEGTLTTAWAVCVAVFYLLSQPETLSKLKAELL
jgi:cytochrome P450